MVNAEKPVKHLILHIFRNADPLVADAYFDSFFEGNGSDGHLTPGRRIFNGIGDKIVQHLSDTISIGRHRVYISQAENQPMFW